MQFVFGGVCVNFYLFFVFLRADALGENMSLKYVVIHSFSNIILLYVRKPLGVY